MGQSSGEFEQLYMLLVLLSMLAVTTNKVKREIKRSLFPSVPTVYIHILCNPLLRYIILLIQLQV